MGQKDERCESCRHYVPAELCLEGVDPNMDAHGYKGLCGNPTNYDRVVYLLKGHETTCERWNYTTKE